MKKILINSILMSSMTISALSSTALAETGDVAVGIKAGTLGMGIDGFLGFSQYFNARTGFNFLNYHSKFTKSNLDYNFNLRLRSLPILIDWHPMGDDSGFRLTTGMLINNNQILANAILQDSNIIGDGHYSAKEIGTLKAVVKVKNGTSPYVGMGWGNPFRSDSAFSYSFDLGVVFQGSPDVSLTADGPISYSPAFQTNLQKENNKFKNDTAEFKCYPSISVGFTYAL